MRLLLDAHLSPAIARALQRHGVDAVALNDWLDGALRVASDEAVLMAGHDDRRVLVSYDLRTLPTLLRSLAETGQSHVGVVLVDQKTIRPQDVGGLLRALRALAGRSDEDSWRDRVVFLQMM